jgi:hypothetical protein
VGTLPFELLYHSRARVLYRVRVNVIVRIRNNARVTVSIMSLLKVRVGL